MEGIMAEEAGPLPAWLKEGARGGGHVPPPIPGAQARQVEEIKREALERFIVQVRMECLKLAAVGQEVFNTPVDDVLERADSYLLFVCGTKRGRHDAQEKKQEGVQLGSECDPS
jgi:hypothetical protein